MTLAPFVRRAMVGPVDGWQGFDNSLDQVFARATYPVDIREDADHLYVEAELPGFKKDEVDITLENNELTISAEHKSDQKTEGNNGEWLLSERRTRSFRRTFLLPPTVDGAKVNATLTDGILTISLDKRQETKPRKITVG